MWGLVLIWMNRREKILPKPFGADLMRGLIVVLAVRSCTLLFGLSPALAAETTTPQDPCGLLSAAEVEAVLGEPLVGPAFREANGVADPNGGSCRYETANFRSIDISVDWDDGGTKLALLGLVSSVLDQSRLKGLVILSDGTEVHGAWDQAKDFMCCEFNAQRGKALVVVDISSSRATLQQAASLADFAVQRLDHPLPSPDTAGIDAATKRAKTRPPITSVCSLVTRAEAETIVDAPLGADPKGDDSSCRYSWTAAGTDYEQELTLGVTWRGGLAAMRQAQAAIGQAMSFLSSEGLADQKQQSAGGLFDEHAESIIGVMAVRKDVLLSVEGGFMNNDLATAFIAAAAKKL